MNKRQITRRAFSAAPLALCVGAQSQAAPRPIAGWGIQSRLFEDREGSRTARIGSRVLRVNDTFGAGPALVSPQHSAGPVYLSGNPPLLRFTAASEVLTSQTTFPLGLGLTISVVLIPRGGSGVQTILSLGEAAAVAWDNTGAMGNGVALAMQAGGAAWRTGQTSPACTPGHPLHLLLRVTAGPTGFGTELLLDGLPVASAFAPGAQAPAPAPLTIGSGAVSDFIDVQVFAGPLPDAMLTPLFDTLRWFGITQVRTIASAGYNGPAHLARISPDELAVVCRNGTSHQSDRGRIQLYRGAANGTVWQQPQTVAAHPSLDLRDPCLMRRANGQLLLSYHDFDIALGRSTPGSLHLQRSRDNGRTWDPPITIPSPVTRAAYCSAPVVECANGDLLLPYTSRENFGTYGGTRAAISRDGGNTWTEDVILTDGNADGITYLEPNVIALPDRRLLALVRSSSNTIRRCWSTDFGRTWSPREPVFIGRGAPRMALLPDGRIVAIHRSDLASSVQANRTVLHVSRDMGRSWNQQEQILDAQPLTCLYGGVVPMGGDTVACGYGVELSPAQAHIRCRTLRLLI